jgi:hypothetical protein
MSRSKEVETREYRCVRLHGDQPPCQGHTLPVVMYKRACACGSTVFRPVHRWASMSDDRCVMCQKVQEVDYGE